MVTGEAEGDRAEFAEPPAVATPTPGDDADARLSVTCPLTEAGFDVGPSSDFRRVDLRHPVDRDQQRTPIQHEEPPIGLAIAQASNDPYGRPRASLKRSGRPAEEE